LESALFRLKSIAVFSGALKNDNRGELLGFKAIGTTSHRVFRVPSDIIEFTGSTINIF
jgi:hypothetical protein